MVSPATGKVYGLQRVCRVLGVARSTVYARRKAASSAKPEPAKRGPKPTVSDEALLEAIRTDLAASPLHGEGHRKVWARLKFGHGIRVARKRVLRVMRDNHLLSPRHRPQRRGQGEDDAFGHPPLDYEEMLQLIEELQKQPREIPAKEPPRDR